MAPRLDLQTLLEGILGSDQVFFQPPTNVLMTYPAIVYERSRIAAEHADNVPYKIQKRYKVTVIHRDPDNTIVDAISALPSCVHDVFFAADNLNHDVFTLYF